jgi:ParB/RepB/Spo0J family partition protein
MATTNQPDVITIPFLEVKTDHPFFENCRTHLTKIEELSASIRDNGLLNPLTVWGKPGSDGKEEYFLVAGRRRHSAISQIRASDETAFENITVSVERNLTVETAFAKNLEENIHQESLNAAEEAIAVIKLYEQIPNQEKVGTMLGKSQPWVSQRVSLIRNLIPAVLDALKTNEINFTQAKAIAKLRTDTGNPNEAAQLLALDRLKNAEDGVRSLLEKTKTGRSKGEIFDLYQMVENANAELGTVGKDHRDSVLQTLRWLRMEVDTDDMIFPTTTHATEDIAPDELSIPEELLED